MVETQFLRRNFIDLLRGPCSEPDSGISSCVWGVMAMSVCVCVMCVVGVMAMSVCVGVCDVWGVGNGYECVGVCDVWGFGNGYECVCCNT